MQKLFLTFFGIGLLPKAPGTWGSIAGAIVAYLVLLAFSNTTLFLASILLFLVSISIINEYEKSVGEHDSSHIVIDEVAGVWLAIAISGGTITQILLSFVFFRVLDITKPSIIGRIDKDVKGGLGVMGDDMVAGFFAGLMSAIIYGICLKLGVNLI
ncbi:phosphatidylglycerophosphatase A [Campylobacter sp. faydin G-24]|uniref:Phosphatidylglycerophosphatase A n=1 Tax=Campylobacter anatolicus TaxID=2829105 RepID=A0ABS5HJX4_9BACT|nr:phosphatidylglycerophosphatase A [Campylobacter anatolicus]MBR8462651.1 phosphatidylglycerophosphatase A [Campylobacter anatolicus]MBR8464549.1 phosphatidylglycerophosphatase A [Campylobacter anatolicus]MBR8465763.1 phosphatidylglycerophosphatase A [Campylobacter anatolicus]